MPHIDSTVVIGACMKRVFDLISRPHKFARCSKNIVQVVPLGNKKHHWEVRVVGVTLGFDSVTTESRRPEYLAWRSVTGIENSGSYALAKTKQGTVVTFEMDYHLTPKILDEVVAQSLGPQIQGAVKEVLECIKGLLENDTEPEWSPSEIDGDSGETN
jgi:uncharacterized membrane protein